MFGGLAYRSFIFWPVGCGDSTTVVISDAVIVQIDLNDGAIADSGDNEREFPSLMSSWPSCRGGTASHIWRASY
jgi:hypothetical protein